MAKFDGEIDFSGYNQAAQPVDFYGSWADDVIEFNPSDDRVNSPSHYTRGTQEAIDIIEEAIDAAPTNKVCYVASTSVEISVAHLAQR